MPSFRPSQRGRGTTPAEIVRQIHDELRRVAHRTRRMKELKDIPPEQRYPPDPSVWRKGFTHKLEWQRHAHIARTIREELRASGSSQNIHELERGNKNPSRELMKQALRELDKLSQKMPDKKDIIAKWPALMARRAKYGNHSVHLSEIEQAVNLLYLAKCRRLMRGEDKEARELVWRNLPF